MRRASLIWLLCNSVQNKGSAASAHVMRRESPIIQRRQDERPTEEESIKGSEERALDQSCFGHRPVDTCFGRPPVNTRPVNTNLSTLDGHTWVQKCYEKLLHEYQLWNIGKPHLLINTSICRRTKKRNKKSLRRRDSFEASKCLSEMFPRRTPVATLSSLWRYNFTDFKSENCQNCFVADS